MSPRFAAEQRAIGFRGAITRIGDFLRELLVHYKRLIVDSEGIGTGSAPANGADVPGVSTTIEAKDYRRPK
jgi:hypothetical protein